MLEIKELSIKGYEKVIHAINPEANLNCFIAIHNTKLGPALGGTRIYPYHNEQEALEDVLRLSKAMTYKSALAEVGLGGGKAVLIADPKTDKNEKLFTAFGEVINTFQGRFITAEDVGSSVEDMLAIHRHTPYVAALPTPTSSGDPSRFTARGVFLGILAVAETLWGTKRLDGKKIAVQGLGHVGEKLCRWLFWHGAELIACDTDTEKALDVGTRYEATIVPPEEFLTVPCDIFSPCAMGGILNEESIPLLRCKAIAGSANNQLLREEDGELLHKRGILYAPDFVINAGGIVNAAQEFYEEGYSPRGARDKVNVIYDTLMAIFAKSREKDEPTYIIADHLAEYKLSHSLGKRKTPITFSSV